MKPEHSGLRPGDGNPDGQGDGNLQERWVPLGEAARELRVSRAAIYRRVERGTMRSRPRGNRGLEVLLPEHPGNVMGNHHRDIQGGRHPDEQGYVTSDILELRDELAEARTMIARLKERLAAASPRAQAAVDAATLAARAEVEAMRVQVATQIASRNTVIEELKTGLGHERTRSEGLAAELAEARKGWLERLLEGGAATMKFVLAFVAGVLVGTAALFFVLGR
jgi:hypothetical protein